MAWKLLVFNFFLFHRFKFRATNVMGQFTDSDYSDPIKTLGKTYFAVFFHLYTQHANGSATFISKCINP